MTIARLRRAMDAAAGTGAGHALIETGTTEEYRLTIPRADLPNCVALEPTFFELEALKVVSAEQAESLRDLCRVVDPT